MAKNSSPYMHFMMRFADAKPLGWIAPAEQPEHGPTGGSYVIPVAKNGRFSKLYQVDFMKYAGAGQRGPTETTEAVVEQAGGKNLFVFQVAGQFIVFQEKPGDPALTRLKYIGQLAHPD